MASYPRKPFFGDGNQCDAVVGGTVKSFYVARGDAYFPTIVIHISHPIPRVVNYLVT